ncbi:MAG: hypothetical protein IT479_16215 [Xanthomonadales bacterium]|nr:hypothetical protein [Xanthomonadales bacterium]MCC6594806.1 hypothetical protein [Xanthomonadales bacterium]MCE7929980.1 hypothetical protein [Xanthomonadales bacterium PRO6]
MRTASRWLLPLLTGLLLVLAWAGPLDEMAAGQSQAGLKRALATFAAARALNGAISVAQGTEVAVEPAGVGVTFAPGQVLDPVNDLVEQFSTLMLTASVSFGVQGVLVAIGGHWLASLALSAALLGWLAYRPWLPQSAPPPWLARVALLLLLVRFAVPLAALGSDLCFRAFLADRYAASQQALALGEREVSELAQPTEAPAESMGERVQRWWADARAAVDVEARLAALRETATRVTEHVVELIVVFLLQTLIVPTLLLWALWRAALGLLAPRG